MRRAGPEENRRGFTIIELLVVVGIIALLVGIIAPGLRAVTRQAKSLKEKAAIKGMEAGLEMFMKDFSDYPQSQRESNAGQPPYVCGAQHLVEALVGRDGRGFEPSTDWYAPNQPQDLYKDDDKSLNRRKGLYVDARDSVAVLLYPDLYDTAPADLFSSNDRARAPVFTDIFKHRQVTLADGTKTKVGNPIVYFKANAASRYFGDKQAQPDTKKWIYSYEDNRDIFALGSVKGPADYPHRFSPGYTDPSTNEKGEDIFYKSITDPTVQTAQFKKPYNSKTFILMSAGWDGVFGTKDDITNFNY